MTNLERWRDYTKHLFSPDSFIDGGWLYTISAALQRRVWYGDIRAQPLFPNLYMVDVGPPATGKGLVLGEITSLLKYHKFAPQNTEYSKKAEAQYLFPPGPDDLTYEKLCEDLASATRSNEYINGENKRKIYSYASMAFVLEELETLFKKRDNTSLTKFLLKAYDCKDHDYKTKHQGENCIRNPCVAMLAGCVPDFIPQAIKHNIFNDGFVSRTIFIYEWFPRKNPFFLEQPDESQLEHRKHLLAHIASLSKVFGPLSYEKGLREHLIHWWDTEEIPRIANCHPKMATYYGRKRVHVMKMAAAFHFSESTDRIITRSDFDKAISFLSKLEVNMERGFSAAGKNEYTNIQKDILAYISRQHSPVSKTDLLIRFRPDLELVELESLLNEFTFTGELRNINDKYEVPR